MDNLKTEGEFTTRIIEEYRPAEKPVVKKPEDNLKLTGRFEGKRKTQEVVTKVERTEVKKHEDQLKLNEGKMETTTTNTSAFKSVTPVKKDVVDEVTKKKFMKSSISLGDDTTILRTTNQMNFNTITTRKDALTEKATKDDRLIRDGALAITTVKVTTILENEKDHTPIREVIRNTGKTNEREEVRHTTSQVNVTNRKNIVNETNQYNQTTKHQKITSGSDDVRSLTNLSDTTHRHITDRTANDNRITQNVNGSHTDVTSYKTVTDHTTNVDNRHLNQNTSRTDVTTQRNVTDRTLNNEDRLLTTFHGAHTDVTQDKKHTTTRLIESEKHDQTNRLKQTNANNQLTTIDQTRQVTDTDVNRHTGKFSTKSSEHYQSSDIIDNVNQKGFTISATSKATSHDVDSSNKGNVSTMKSVINRSEKTSNRTHTISQGQPLVSGVDHDSTKRVMNSQQNYNSDILNVRNVDSTQSNNRITQSDKITNQLNLRQHESGSTSSMNDTRNQQNRIHQSSNISNVINDNNCNSNLQSSSSQAIDHRRNYVASDQNTQSSVIKSTSQTSHTSQQSHHRKNVLTSSEDVSNSVFHRKSNLTSNSNDALHSNSLSSTAAIQRKSISNLHDAAIYNVPTDRQSYSSLHRQGKELHSQAHSSTTSSVTTTTRGSQQNTTTSSTTGGERAQKIVQKNNLSVGGGDFYGKSESNSYGSFSGGHQNSARDRVVVRRSNQSSISFGDPSSINSNVYRREYATVHNAACPAAHIEQSTFKHTRDTKSHKFYKPTLQ